jgi:hypothetical protein
MLVVFHFVLMLLVMLRRAAMSGLIMLIRVFLRLLSRLGGVLRVFMIGVFIRVLLRLHAIHGKANRLDRLSPGRLFGQRQPGSVLGDHLRIGGW